MKGSQFCNALYPNAKRLYIWPNPFDPLCWRNTYSAGISWHKSATKHLYFVGWTNHAQEGARLVILMCTVCALYLAPFPHNCSTLTDEIGLKPEISLVEICSDPLHYILSLWLRRLSNLPLLQWFSKCVVLHLGDYGIKGRLRVSGVA